MNIPNKEHDEDIHSGYSEECPLIDPGSKKIPKVGWRVREACYHKLYEVLGELNGNFKLYITHVRSI